MTSVPFFYLQFEKFSSIFIFDNIKIKGINNSKLKVLGNLNQRTHVLKNFDEIEGNDEKMEHFVSTIKSIAEEYEKAETLGKQYGMEKDAFISAVGGLYNIEYELLMEKTINFLKENN
jgi:hypothetical protein